MSDRIDLGKEPWQAIPQALLRDSNLSAQAKGGLVSLLSHEPGWVRSVIAILMRSNRNCGRTQAKAIMRELVAAGYAEMHQGRKPDGTFATGYVVHPEPVNARSNGGTSLSPWTGTPASVPPGSVNLSAVVEPLEVDSQEVDAEGKNAAATPSTDTNPNQPTDRQVYFGEKLNVGIPSIVKLNKSHGRAAVLSAMEQLHGFPPENAVENVYAYLDTVASFKAAGA